MIRPLNDRVLVRRMPEEDKIGSLFVPDQNKEKPARGEVLAAGPGRVTEKGVAIRLQVTVGDVVVFGKYSGTEIQVDGEKLVMLREDEILGVEEKS